jgi:hypothetical protein
MTPFQAALRYATKYAFNRKAAAGFAREYENACGSEAAFDAYLDFIWGKKSGA